MYKINFNKDKLLIVAQEIKKNFPDLDLKILINNKIIIKTKNNLDLETKKRLEVIIKNYFPDNILNFQNY